MRERNEGDNHTYTQKWTIDKAFECLVRCCSEDPTNANLLVAWLFYEILQYPSNN